MSEIKALEKLRAAGRNMAKDRNLENHEECNLLLVIADEIQAEIDERFMELPIGADGKLIHVGDEVGIKDDRCIGVVTGIGQGDDPRVWVLLKNKHVSSSYFACFIKHVRTLEDVIMSAIDAALDEDNNSAFGAIASNAADEIRKIMKDCENE